VRERECESVRLGGSARGSQGASDLGLDWECVREGGGGVRLGGRVSEFEGVSERVR
jgi:hypothetical protein